MVFAQGIENAAEKSLTPSLCLVRKEREWGRECRGVCYTGRWCGVQRVRLAEVKRQGYWKPRAV